MEQALLYVSTKSLVPSETETAIADIVAISRFRNATLGVTGALVATTDHFAQILEGPSDSVDALMASILRDARHRDIMILDVADCPSRRFARWSLAYSGPSSYLSRFVAPLAGPDRNVGRKQVQQLVDVMIGLADQG